MVEFLFEDKYFQIKSFTQNLVKIKKTILKIKLVTVIFKGKIRIQWQIQAKII